MTTYQNGNSNSELDCKSPPNTALSNYEGDEYEALIAEKSDDGEDGNAPQTKEVQWNTKHIIKIVLGAGIGSLLEFYSFGLVAYFETELKEAFFPPNSTGYDSLLEEFTLYGSAFAMRPIGGLIFGYIGDKHGRVYSLRLSLIAMIVPTVLYGLLPTYSTIGTAATVLVFLFRIIQGLCVGGEMSTALVYIIEEAPSHMKATLTGYLYAMSCGSYLSLIVYALWSASASGEVMAETTVDWSWRLAFISSLLIGIFGVYIRRLLPNSYEFDNISANDAILQNPMTFILEQFRMEFFILFLGYIAPPIIYYSSVVWLPAYLNSTLSNTMDIYAYDVQLVSGALSIAFVALSGQVCDQYFGFYAFAQYFLPATIVNVLVCYSVISVTQNIYVICMCQILLSLNSFGGMSCTYWCAAWIPDARIRNTLTGMTYNLGMALFVSTLFDVETYLANTNMTFGGMYAGIYVALLCVMSLGAIVYAHKYHSWKNYHFYGSLNPHNMDENDEDDITDEDIEMQNPYSVI